MILMLQIGMKYLSILIVTHNPLDNPYKLIDSVAETKIIIFDSS